MMWWQRSGQSAPISTSASGARAEHLAEVFLRQHGLKTLDRNFSCKQGELDLIMEEDATLVFVEVRYRKSGLYGSAAETVTRSKQQKLIAAAQHYLLQHKAQATRPMRFDVLGIMPGSANDYDYTWLKNAFEGLV